MIHEEKNCMQQDSNKPACNKFQKQKINAHYFSRRITQHAISLKKQHAAWFTNKNIKMK